MITPKLRARFGHREVAVLVDAIDHHPLDDRPHLRRLLDHEGIDAVISDPGFDPTRLWGGDDLVTPPMGLCLYALTRQALTRSRLTDVELADYVASLLSHFALGRRAFRVGGDAAVETSYLVDIFRAGRDGHPGAHQHMGDFALWVAGLFPDWVMRRHRRRGAPGLDYYDEMGRSGYSQAAHRPAIQREGLVPLMVQLAEHFTPVRRALNHVSDTHFFPAVGADAVERLIRDVLDRDVDA